MIAVAALAAQYAGTLDLLDTTSLSARTSQPAPIFMQGDRLKKILIASDLSTAPAARLVLRGHQTDYSLSYSPSVTASDVELGLDPQVFHTAAAAAAWHDRFARVWVSESLSYGTSFVLAQIASSTQGMLAGQMPPAQMPAGQAPSGQAPSGQVPGGPMPPTGAMAAPSAGMPASQAPTLQQSFLQFFSSSTNGGASLRTGRRAILSLDAGYGVSGGLNDAARTYLPWQYGPSAGASVSYLASTRDSVAVSAGAAEAITSGPCLPPQTGHCEESAPYGQARATLRHQLSVRGFVSLSAGAWASIVTTNTLQETLLVPTANAAFSYRLGAHATDNLGLSAGLEPAIDVRTGFPSYRLSTTGSLMHPVSSTVGVTATAGMTRSIPFPVFFAKHPETASISSDPNPITALDGGADARFRLERERSLSVGVHGFWQIQSGFAPLASISLFARIGLNRQVDLGAGVQTFWQGLVSYDTLPNQIFTSGFVVVSGRLKTLRF